MTFPSRRDRGYRHDLARAIFWARAWSLWQVPVGGRQPYTSRGFHHYAAAWQRLYAFTGGLL